MSDNKRRDELAEEYSKEWVLDELHSCSNFAFKAGYDAARAESEIRKHANEIKDKAMAEALTRIQDRAEKLANLLSLVFQWIENLDPSIDTLATRQALAEYSKGGGE